MRPGYKQTEVGVIPEEWEVASLSREVDGLEAGVSVNSVDNAVASYQYDHAVLKTSSVVDGKFVPQESKAIAPRDVRRARLSPRKDSIIISRMNTPDLVGECGYVSADFPCLFLPDRLWMTRNPSGDVCVKWLNYLLSSKPYKRKMKGLATGTSGSMKNIAKDALLSMLVPYPKGPEQRAIAAALSDVDALLDGLDRLIAKKRDLKQAAMQQLLTGETRLPGFSGEWEETQVQDVIARFFCGPSPTCEERNIQDEIEWGVLKTTAATKEYGWDWRKHKTLPRTYWNKPHIELKKGDVIVTKAGPRHRVGVTAWVNYVPPRIIPSGKMIALRPCPDKATPLMLAAAISAGRAQTYLDQRTTGMAESQVNFENIALLEAPITVPSIEEQTAIAAVLSYMDAELAALEARRDKTRDLKQAMMQELLTGSTRLV